MGIHSWDDFGESKRERLPLGRQRIRNISHHLDQSFARLQANDPNYFGDLLPLDQHWRLFRDFRDGVAYLDIETTGMGTPQDYHHNDRLVRWQDHLLVCSG